MFANAIMHGIHDVFPPDDDDNKDPISEKKIKKVKGLYDIKKTLLGFDFDGDAKTMWLELAKQEKLLTILKGWIRTGKQGSIGIPFSYYESTILKIRHAFKSIPGSAGYCRRATASSKVPTICILAVECGRPHGA